MILITVKELIDSQKIILDTNSFSKRICENYTYLLKSLGYIESYDYSSKTYFYPVNPDLIKVYLKRKNTECPPFDIIKLGLSKISYLENDRKRKQAFEKIQQILNGDPK